MTPQAITATQAEIKAYQEKRRARMSADELKRRFAAFTADIDSGVVNLKPRVFASRELPPAAA